MVTKEHEYMAQALQVTGFALMTPFDYGIYFYSKGACYTEPKLINMITDLQKFLVITIPFLCAFIFAFIFYRSFSPKSHIDKKKH